jgi:Ni,Fe-hydrogenase III small subunit
MAKAENRLIALDRVTPPVIPIPGGPPTPAEIHDAQMVPWPGHNLAQTLARNRARQADDGSTPDQG